MSLKNGNQTPEGTNKQKTHDQKKHVLEKGLKSHLGRSAPGQNQIEMMPIWMTTPVSELEYTYIIRHVPLLQEQVNQLDGGCTLTEVVLIKPTCFYNFSLCTPRVSQLQDGSLFCISHLNSTSNSKCSGRALRGLHCPSEKFLKILGFPFPSIPMIFLNISVGKKFTVACAHGLGMTIQESLGCWSQIECLKV